MNRCLLIPPFTVHSILTSIGIMLCYASIARPPQHVSRVTIPLRREELRRNRAASPTYRAKSRGASPTRLVSPIPDKRSHNMNQTQHKPASRGSDSIHQVAASQSQSVDAMMAAMHLNDHGAGENGTLSAPSDDRGYVPSGVSAGVVDNMGSIISHAVSSIGEEGSYMMSNSQILPGGGDIVKSGTTLSKSTLKKNLKRGYSVPIRFANANKTNELDIYFTNGGGKINYINLPPLHRSLRKTTGMDKKSHNKEQVSKHFDGLDCVFSYVNPRHRYEHCSVDDSMETSLKFCNLGEQHALHIYWINYEGVPVFRRKLDPGENYIEHTFATHCWIVYDLSTENNLLIHLGTEAVTASQKYSIVWNPADSSSNKASVMSQEMNDSIESSLDNTNNVTLIKVQKKAMLSTSVERLKPGVRTTLFEKREIRAGEQENNLRKSSIAYASDAVRNACIKFNVSVAPMSSSNYTPSNAA
jgi:hypothetical protein